MSNAKLTKSELYRSRAARRGPYPHGHHAYSQAIWWDGEVLDHAIGFGIPKTAEKFGIEPSTVKHVLAAQKHVEVAVKRISLVVNPNTRER